jgi:hypothetical protein
MKLISTFLASAAFYLLVNKSIIVVKFCENDPIVPRLNLFSAGRIMHRIKDVRVYESIAIHMLNYKLDYFTPFHFIEFYFYNGFIFDQIEYPIEKIYSHIYEILEIFIFDKRSVNYTPFQISTSCIVYVLELLNASKDFFVVYNIKESEYIDALNYLKE